MANFITCDGGLDSAGDLKSCLEAFAPSLSMTMPDSVGMPTMEITIPDFSGIDPEAIIKSLEFIGLDACALIQATLGPLAGVAAGFVGQLQATLDGVVNMPQEIADGLQQKVQGDIDGLFGPMDTLMGAFDSDACTTLAGAANSGMEQAIAANDLAQAANDAIGDVTSDLTSVTNDIASLDNVVSDATIGNVKLDQRLTAIGG